MNIVLDGFYCNLYYVMLYVHKSKPIQLEIVEL